MRGFLLTTTMLCAFSGLCALSGVANAQEGAATTEDGLGEIVVTAQRREESSQRAAVPLSVIDGSTMLSSGITQADRLSQLAPALTIQPSSTGNLIFLRGVGNFTLVATSDPAIAFNYDGVYVGRPTSSTGVFYDLARVEILKGPQGILYGRNATGGAINILPVQPKLGETSGYVSGTFGNYNTINAEGAINVPMGEKTAVRLSLSTSNHDGYLRDGMQDEKTVAGRIQLKSELTSDLTIRLAADFAHNGGNGNSVSYFGRYARNVTAPVVAGPVAGTSYYTFIPTTLDPSEGIFSPASQAYRTSTPFGPFGRTLDAFGPPARVDNNFYGINAEIAWDVGPGTLSIIPAWRYTDLDYNAAAAAFAYDNVETAKQYSLEMRFAGERIGILDYTLGAYYYDETIHSITSLSISNTGSFLDQTLATKSYAGFGRLTAHLSDQVRIVGGVRYTHDQKGFDYAATGAVVNCAARNAFGAPACPTAPFVPLFDRSLQLPFAFPALGGAPIPVFTAPGPPNYLIIRTDTFFNRSLSSSRVTYRGAIEFDVAPQSLLYASVESGYRSGGFSAAAGFETYQPEFITAYTIGMKNRFLNNRVQLNIEGFIWDYNNQQVNFVGLDINGRTANRTQNVGSSKIKGIEVESRFLVTPTTLISADIQYLDAQQKEYTYSAGAGNPPLTGCAVSFNAAAVGTTPPYTINCAGNQSYNSPKWTMNLAAQQTIPLGDHEIIVGVDTQYKSSRNLGFAYLPEQTIGSTWTSNAQVSFGAADKRWSIAAYVRNIENKRIQLFNSTHPTALFLTAGQSAPRTYGIRGSFKF